MRKKLGAGKTKGIIIAIAVILGLGLIGGGSDTTTTPNVGVYQEQTNVANSKVNSNIDFVTSETKATTNEVVKTEEKTETVTQSGTSTTTSSVVTSQTETKTSSVETVQKTFKKAIESHKLVDVSSIPAYSNKAYVAINNNVPYFTESEMTTTSYEYYSELDSLGRCGFAVACIGKETMPTEERGEIGSVKPTAWQSVKYDIVSGKYLYNRCHLIAFCLSGENANKKNLITGTRYMNTEGMLLFEDMVLDYVKETGNHVIYRVTPVFEGDNLLASGVLIEAKSVEDNGDGILFNVYCYNVQPGIEINYKNGNSSLIEEKKVEETKKSTTPTTKKETEKTYTYILNTNTKKFHYSSCSSVKKMAEKNKSTFTGTRSAVIKKGYSACGNCKP